MKTLLDIQADPNASATDGLATIHAAAISGNKPAVRELALAKGIDMERRVAVKSDSGHEVGLTAFLLACDAGEMDAAAAIAAKSPLCGHACTDRLESGAHLLARCSTVRG
jgi:ankyrin repeat protein